MQDRTINNALLALRKQGGSQGMLAEVLLDMRGVELPMFRQVEPVKRGGTKWLILRMLQERPHSAAEIGAAIRKAKPTLGKRSAYNRGYQALLRLEESGLVRREGRVWLSAAGSSLTASLRHPPSPS